VGADITSWSRALLENNQIKPEYIINLGGLTIVCLQVLVSFIVRKTSPLTSIIWGVTITVASFFIYLIAPTGWIVIAAIFVFTIGEMLASPRSKEYAGRIAPPEKVGMYMGYFYWCVALGNLFGGLLSGVAYQHLGPAGMDRPGLMWILFAALAATTAVALVVYNRVALGPRASQESA
jgi:predicted MFS family arabinose efflux permease